MFWCVSECGDVCGSVISPPQAQLWASRAASQRAERPTGAPTTATGCQEGCSTGRWVMGGYWALFFFFSSYRLVGLVVKAPTLGAEDPGSKSCLQRDFSGSSHTGDLKIGTPVAILPGAWHYRVSWDWSAWCQYTVTG